MSTPPRSRWLEVEQVGEVALAKLTRRELLEDETIEAVGEQMFLLVDNMGCRKLVLSLAATRRMSSLMLGKIMSVHKKMKAAGGRLALCGIDPDVYRIFETLRLPQLLTIYKDEQEALQSF